MTEITKTESTTLAQFESSKFQSLEQFTKLLNKKPKEKELTETFDKKAKVLPISYVETLLDEIYLRQWGTEDVGVLQIANEICIHLTLWVIDPFTGMKITRAGFAAAAMQWDAVPDELKASTGVAGKRERNAWAMDLQNKKQESLKLVFPKVKAMAIKNAAQSLGKSFGRDINRKHEDFPTEFYTDLINNTEQASEAKVLMEKAKTNEEFQFIWDSYPDLKEDDDFKKNFMYYKRKNVK